jgi:hypothetical protein
MDLDDWFTERGRALTARTQRLSHGCGELTLINGVPVRATGCTLRNGALTDAECLLPNATVTHDSQRVWIRRLPNSALRCRGRLHVDPGRALRFEDMPDANLPGPAASAPPAPDLEQHLGASERIRDLVRGDVFATLLYGALCNTTWRHKATGHSWSCTWRHAGGVVAALRSEGDYLDWYCSAGEGLVDLQVLEELGALGWELCEAAPTGRG